MVVVLVLVCWWWWQQSTVVVAAVDVVDTAVFPPSFYPFYSSEQRTQATAPQAVEHEIFSSCGNGAVATFLRQ
ncbi:Hypothetical predicted protein [Olea europaea subsp. europaea]|uniref:Secreted protein n=1 Tax=Olea europaea subsp. europaea TaxID=158383 RepID=A0A8S0VBG2_OLEEU|nr:Hypothetical predicted protein [Olea europaea subsp. europaea]